MQRAERFVKSGVFFYPFYKLRHVQVGAHNHLRQVHHFSKPFIIERIFLGHDGVAGKAAAYKKKEETGHGAN
jgi:hypothetical protein